MSKSSTVSQLNYLVVVVVIQMAEQETITSSYSSWTLIQQRPFSFVRNLEHKRFYQSQGMENLQQQNWQQRKKHPCTKISTSSTASDIAFPVLTLGVKQLECLSSDPASLSATQVFSFYLTCLRLLTRPGICYYPGNFSKQYGDQNKFVGNHYSSFPWLNAEQV